MPSSEILEEDTVIVEEGEESNGEENEENLENENENAQPAEQKRPTRFLVHKIVMENFKSYAGTQEIGPFHKSFSSIVGPNGSGKSNVIDALLFVFGKRAKDIRLKKVGELIHHSDNHKNLQSAKVSVHFVTIYDDTEEDATDDYQIVPDSQLTISRVCWKNNTSKYFVNNKNSTYTEVTKLLMSKGIDLDNNRFLILQGEVEQIALMKPKAGNEHEVGLLEYLEDIIGSNKYVSSIEESYQELENLNESRMEKVSRVKIVEKDKDNLERAKEEAEEFLNKEKQIITKKSVLYQLHRSEADKNLEGVIEKKEELDLKLQEEKDKLKLLTEEKKEIEVKHKKENKDYEKVAAQMNKAKTEFAQFERANTKHKEDQKHLKAKKKKIETSITTQKKQEKEYTVSQESQETEIVANKKELETLNQNLITEEKKLEKIMESLKPVTVGLQQELEKNEQALIPFRNELDEQQSKYDITKTKRDTITANADQAKEQLENAEKSLKEIEEMIDNFDTNISEKKKELKNLEKKSKEFENEKQNLAQKEQQLMKEQLNLKTKIEDHKSTQQEAKSKGVILDNLMKLKNPGIYGRLGDLGAIDSQYDVAISTACTALDHIVVDSTETGQLCLDILKKQRLGRATFIILEKQQYLRNMCNKKIDTPQNAPRLFDLIKPKDEIFLPAFYFAIRDTLVAKNLDSAAQVAFPGGNKRFRVVTLGGDVIDVSGTMSGGGTRKASGGMSSTLSENVMTRDELKGVELQLNDITKQLVELRDRKLKLEQDIKDIQTQISDTEIEIDTMNIDFKDLPERKKSLEDSIPALTNKMKIDSQDKKKVEKLEEQLKSDEKDLLKAKKNCEKIEKEIQNFQDQILNAGGTKLKVQKSKVESLSEQIDQTEKNITKCEVSIKTCQRNIKKSSKVISKSQEDLEELNQEIEKQQNDFKDTQENAEKVKESYQETQNLLDEKTEYLKTIQAEFDKLKKKETKMRTVEIDIQNQVDDITRILTENQNKAQHWGKKITDLNKQLIRMRVDEEDEVETVQVLSPEELVDFDKQEISHEIALLEESLDKMKPNMGAIREYRKKEKEHEERAKELDTITDERDSKRKEYEELRKKRLDDFMEGFRIITMKLKEMYQMITLGGDAELELVDSLDPFSEGIVFSVRPPKKSWKNISNLSGGEKTLSSLALVFALHHYKPTPLYIMDEIDAALDFKNVSIVANYIKERTKNAQFVIVSLRNYMFELADRLVGIYKTSDCTKSVTIAPKHFSLE